MNEDRSYLDKLMDELKKAQELDMAQMARYRELELELNKQIDERVEIINHLAKIHIK